MSSSYILYSSFRNIIKGIRLINPIILLHLLIFFRIMLIKTKLALSKRQIFFAMTIPLCC